MFQRPLYTSCARSESDLFIVWGSTQSIALGHAYCVVCVSVCLVWLVLFSLFFEAGWSGTPEICSACLVSARIKDVHHSSKLVSYLFKGSQLLSVYYSFQFKISFQSFLLTHFLAYVTVTVFSSYSPGS